MNLELGLFKQWLVAYKRCFEYDYVIEGQIDIRVTNLNHILMRPDFLNFEILKTV